MSSSQLSDIRRQINARFDSLGVPVKVVIDPERTESVTYARERIVIEHRGPGTDGFIANRTRQGNPAGIMTRVIGARASIYAQATNTGATKDDHEGRAEAILDELLKALDHVLRGNGALWALGTGGFVSVADGAKSQTSSGALYELDFSYERAVLDHTWATNAAAPEATLGGDDGVSIANTTQVTLANGPENATPETGCGG